MATLMVTLGTAPMIVVEALLSAPSRYDRVRIITSSDPAVQTTDIETFLSGQGPVDYRIERVPGLTGLHSQDEQDLFEDAVYRWYLDAIAVDDEVDACISGGFKSMSAVLQKAAHLLGARDVFHVLADGNPSDLPAVRLAIAEGKVRRISLGAEPGWAALRRWALTLRDDMAAGALRRTFRAQTGRLQQAADRIASGGGLPFNDLSLLGPDQQDWLGQPLDGETDREWIARLPKVELHCHLGGFATHGAELDAVRAASERAGEQAWPAPPGLPQGWPMPKQPIGLEAYTRLGDANGSALLSDPGCLREQVRRIYARLIDDNILHAEIRCSPNNYTGHGAAAVSVLEAIQATFEGCMEDRAKTGEWVPGVSLLVIVTRRQSGDLSGIARHLALAVTAAGANRACRVVGVDLAGYEEERTRPVYFQTDFQLAHRCGLAVTVHAGENDDVESIWQAVYKLSARRLGHALHLEQSPDLLRVVRDRGIGVEMCPYANLQIHGFEPMEGRPAYPLLRYLRAGVNVTINTDNPGISAAGLTDNMRLLARLCPGMTRIELLQCLRNSLEVAFLQPEERAALRERMSQKVYQVCALHAR